MDWCTFWIVLNSFENIYVGNFIWFYFVENSYCQKKIRLKIQWIANFLNTCIKLNANRKNHLGCIFSMKKERQNIACLLMNCWYYDSSLVCNRTILRLFPFCVCICCKPWTIEMACIDIRSLLNRFFVASRITGTNTAIEMNVSVGSNIIYNFN